MASSAMRCAAGSPKPSWRWQLRTSSAKAPPPGTTTIGCSAAVIASSHGVSRPERTTLPPSLTTTGRASCKRGLSAAFCNAAASMSGLSLAPHDFDAHGARILIELLDTHRDTRRPGMGQAMLRHLIGQRLHQIDVAARYDRFDAIGNVVVIQRLIDVVVEDLLGGRHVDVDREAHALGDALLVMVNPNLHVEHVVVHENAVERLARIARGGYASQSLCHHRLKVLFPRRSSSIERRCGAPRNTFPARDGRGSRPAPCCKPRDRDPSRAAPRGTAPRETPSRRGRARARARHGLAARSRRPPP